LRFLGENGAGKSTLIKILGGIYKKDSGQIFIDEKPVEINSIADARKYGVSIIHQELMLCKNISIAENIFMGNEICKTSGIVSLKSQERRAQEIIEEYGLDLNASSVLGELTIAQQQMVEIIRAISFGSKIIVMDEPTSSLSEKEVQILFGMIRALKEKNVGIIYISHRLDELFEISDKIEVLRDGMDVGVFYTSKVKREELVNTMVGRELTKYYFKDNVPQNETVMEVKGLSDGKMVKNANFILRKGEILGIAGLVGAGRSETMECIFGITKRTAGIVTLNGKEVCFKSPMQAMSSGIGLVPEDRKNTGLFLQQDVRFNTTITTLDRIFRHLRYFGKKENEIVDKMINDIQIKVTGRDQVVGDLSGGNQQKVLIGKWLLSVEKVLILDEPTRGVDVKTKAEIYALINKLAKEGLAIIIVSSELPELINMSDRIVVFSNGYTTGELNREEFSQERIMTLATTEQKQ
jgi:ABC-type sugar transport system ATPase subunit